VEKTRPGQKAKKNPKSLKRSKMSMAFNPWSAIPREERPAFEKILQSHTADLLQAHGIRAFQNPRSAAIAHETGHAIVGTHDEFKIKYIAIWSAGMVHGAEGWMGITKESERRWSFSPQTPLLTALNRVCYIIAGEAGEVILDPDNYRKGSSLDEVVLSQRMALDLAHRASSPARTRA
jgi:hypothetical protein